MIYFLGVVQMSYRRHREFPISALRENNYLKLETKLYRYNTNEIVKAERAMHTITSFFFRPLINANSSLFFRNLRQIKFIQNNENELMWCSHEK